VEVRVLFGALTKAPQPRGFLVLRALETARGEPGLSPLSSVRNLALVRICELLRTPSGARIVENQASGISTADAACREAGTLPPLFVDQPTALQVFLLRGALDAVAARFALGETPLREDADAIRVVAVALRLQKAREEAAGSPLARVAFDARFVARLLSPCSLADAAAVLRRLEDAGVLHRRRSRRDPTWIIRTDPAATDVPRRRRRGGGDRERVDAVVLALAGSADGELGRDAVGQIIGRSSSRTIVAGSTPRSTPDTWSRRETIRMTPRAHTV